MEITYRQEENLPVHTVEVEWEDGTPRQRMEYADGMWSCQVKRHEGEYLYRLVLDDGVRIVDPECNTYAEDEEGTVWSVLIVNLSGTRLYDSAHHELSLEEYHMTGGVGLEAFAGAADRKSFDTGHDSQISVQIVLGEITGLHVATLLWIAPDGTIFDDSEETIREPENPDRPVRLWFDLDLQNALYEYPHGMWGVKLLIDGTLVLEDEFSLVNRFLHPLFMMQA